SGAPGRGSLGGVRAPGRGSPAPLASSLHGVNLRPPAASRCSARKLAPRSFPRRPPAYVLPRCDAEYTWYSLLTSRCATGAHESSHVDRLPDATSLMPTMCYV